MAHHKAAAQGETPMTIRSIGRIATVLVLAALPAFAADTTSTPTGGRTMAAHDSHDGAGKGHHGHRHHHQGPGMGMMAPERIEGRLAFLKAELKITDAQLPQWNVFADAMRARAKTAGERHAEQRQHGDGHGRHGRAQGAEAQPLPERLANAEQMMTRHLEQMRQFRATVEPLYNVLSPEQRKTADQLLRRKA